MIDFLTLLEEYGGKHSWKAAVQFNIDDGATFSMMST